MEPFALPAPRPPALPDPLALNRATVDRPGAERLEPGLLERLLADPATHIVLVDGARVVVTPPGVPGQAASDSGTGAPRLALASATDLRGDGEAHYLGRDEGGAYVAWSCDLDEQGAGAPGAVGLLTAEALPVSLRDSGHLLDDRDAGLATAAVALSQWRRTHRCCPRCGTRTELVESGWAARCDVDGHVVYPRTDPAVIMAVHDGAWLLLARSVAWPQRRRSVLAGFVEAGESPESAVRREVAEEVGVRIGRVEYAGSQPWPFPASLMLGYHAWAVDSAAVAALRPDGEEITHADWFTREELRVALAEDRVRLPMQTSIALALIESWYGETLPSAP
ncbi:NAD(+) diphosphatase [Salana multivorans]